MVDTWSVGLFEEPGLRVGRALAWLRSDLTGDNGYARPIGGLLAIVDLDRMEVVRIDDHGALPVPEEHGDYRNGGGRPYRDDLRPIEVTQPEGSSLQLDGRALSWGPWRVRIGFNPRESLTLHELAFDAGDGAGPRPIAHRLSIAELAIPYADTNPTVVFKNAFDIGEYGLGPYVNSLALGCDCLGEIRYLDAVVHDSQGRAQTIAQRDLPARGGRRHPLEALRLAQRRDRRPARAQARDLVRSRRSATTSTASTGTSRSTAASRSRPSSRASCTPPAWPRASTRHSATLVAPGRQRRLPPALLLRAARPRRRRRAQRRSARSTRSPIRPGRRTRTGSPSACARRSSRASSRPSG